MDKVQHLKRGRPMGTESGSDKSMKNLVIAIACAQQVYPLEKEHVAYRLVEVCLGLRPGFIDAARTTGGIRPVVCAAFMMYRTLVQENILQPGDTVC